MDQYPPERLRHDGRVGLPNSGVGRAAGSESTQTLLGDHRPVIHRRLPNGLARPRWGKRARTECSGIQDTLQISPPVMRDDTLRLLDIDGCYGPLIR